jgi:phosphoglycolate phosphatase
MTEEIHKELLNGNIPEEIKKLTIPKVQLTDEEKAIRRSEYSKNKLAMPLYEGIKELLIDLHTAGYILTINTSAYERNCLPLLEQENLLELFDFLATSEVSESKVEKFNMIKEKYGVTVGEMIFVTDTLGDLREAERAGIPTICVTWGAHNEDYFTREPHANLVGIVNSMSELKKAIER